MANVEEIDDPATNEEPIIIIVVGSQCRRNVELQRSLKCFPNATIRHSDTGFEHMPSAKHGPPTTTSSSSTIATPSGGGGGGSGGVGGSRRLDTVFVLENFQGDVFRKLARNRCHLVGPQIVVECARNNLKLPIRKRPIYCTAMSSLVLCFTGFKVKEELMHLAELIHNMGGGIRKQYSNNITHLIANLTNSDKFQIAVNMGNPIMHMKWILRTWEENQNSVIVTPATGKEMMKYKLAPFQFSVVAFFGFSKEEQLHMEEITVANGGSCCEVGSSNCTHLVVENSQRSIPYDILDPDHTLVVMGQWFWASIQMDACADETIYPFTEPTTSATTPSSVLSASKSRKRKRLKENLAQLAHDGEVNTPMFKQGTSDFAQDNNRRSMGASFLDITADLSTATPTHGTPGNHSPSPVVIGTPTSVKELAAMSRRLRIVHELFQTENNYVGILQTIIKTFKEELEKPDQIGGAIFDSQTINIIFGKIPAIYQVHIKIRGDLNDLLNSGWTEESSIGDIFLRQADQLLKCYPPFVNYFNNIKEAIVRCDHTVPRFHAFQKVCLSRPECGRQSLTELMIRPVQRLPSILLILKEMLKRTETTNPDHSRLKKAIHSLDDVTLHINEDKRKCEGHQEMFDIINDIENIPANLLSSHRSFITRIDVIELTDELSGRGDPLSLFVFTDCLAFCKRRVKVNSKTTSQRNIGSKTLQKAFKHIEVLLLSSIKRIVDVKSTDSKNVFALVVKTLDSCDERRHAFSVNDDTVKIDFLVELSKTVCDSVCRPDYEKLLTTVDSNILNIDTSDVNSWNISKVANKFSKRVSRAFSLNKTPRGHGGPSSSQGQGHSALPRSVSGMTPSQTSSSSIRSMVTASLDRTGHRNPPVGGHPELAGAVSYSDLVDQKNIGTPLRKKADTKMGPPRTPLMSLRKLSTFGHQNTAPATDDDDYDNISMLSTRSHQMPYRR